MAIKEGDKLPEASMFTMGAEGRPKKVTTADLFAGKKVVVFAVPGAFTPTCSLAHLPGIKEAKLFEPAPERIYSWTR